MRGKSRGETNGQTDRKDPFPYEDLVGLPHPVSLRHPPMDRINRAAQFAPFAALTGYEGAIRETGRMTEAFRPLEEDEQGILQRQLQWLARHLPEKPQVTITYFVPDPRKEGGAYVQVTGSVYRIDGYESMLMMAEGERIPMKYIRSMEVIEEKEGDL